MTTAKLLNDDDINKENGNLVFNPFNNNNIEILEQLKVHPDYIFIPVGGGGLLAGVSVYIKTINPKIKIVAVEAEDSACFNLACQFGKPTSLKHVGIFADGVAVKKIGSKILKKFGIQMNNMLSKNYKILLKRE